jgi:hypothetical protein
MASMFVLGHVSGQALVAFLLASLGMGLLLSVAAVLLEEMSFHLYQRPRHFGVLLAAMLLENFGYRQLTALWRLRAVAAWALLRRSEWGEMKRSADWQVGAPR